MGFLLGILVRKSALDRKTEIQSRLVQIQSELRSAKKNVENIEKQLSVFQRTEENKLNQYAQNFKYQYQLGYNTQIEKLKKDIYGPLLDKPYNQLSEEDKKQYTDATTRFHMESSAIQNNMGQVGSMTDQQVAMQKELLEQEVERQRTVYLEPAKDYELDLQQEKDNLEKEMSLAENEYDAAGKMVDDGVKNLKPNYTSSAT